MQDFARMEWGSSRAKVGAIFLADGHAAMTLGKAFGFQLAFAFALLLCALSAPARRFESVRATAEFSMVLTGSVDIDREGGVVSHALDPEADLSDASKEALRKMIASWRFVVPAVQADAPATRVPMRLQIVLSRKAEDAYSIRLASAQFGEAPKEERVVFARKPRLAPEIYPEQALRQGVRGTVYLAMQVGRDGKPMQVMAEQVNLAVVDAEHRMGRWRDMLARAAIHAAKPWRFVPPSAGKEAGAPFWTVRIGVVFVPRGTRSTRDGRWEVYIPGPRQDVPWKVATDSMVGVGAVASGEPHTVGTGLRLLTPLNGA